MIMGRKVGRGWLEVSKRVTAGNKTEHGTRLRLRFTETPSAIPRANFRCHVLTRSMAGWQTMLVLGGFWLLRQQKVQPMLFGGVYHGRSAVMSFLTFKQDHVSAEC